MKHLQNAIELPEAWTKTGISQSQYESNAAVRRERKYAAIVKSAEITINKAHNRITELRKLAKIRRDLIPVISFRIVSLRDNSQQLDWELRLALDSDDISPWKTVTFYSDTLRVLIDRPL